MGKCGLKVLQYMASGLPVIANSVGIHRKLIDHGETGFLADTPVEWADAVERLGADPALRQRMGVAARQKAEREYNIRRWGPKVARILRNLVSPSVPLPPKVPATYSCPLPDASGQWARS
jgi:glycosyltransferase involved in cell wall biosynthesis